MSSSLFPKRGKRALVTGGAEGIGQAYARRLAADGADVIIIDRIAADATVATIATAGGRARAYVCDLTDLTALDQVNARIIADTGGCDILVNNAGTGSARAFDAIDHAHLRRMLSLNLEAPFLMCKAHVGPMKARGWGRIVNISTAMFNLPAPDFVDYLMSKGGILGLTRGLATDLGRFGITVNAISPGLVRTPLTMGAREGHAPIPEQGFDAVRHMQPIPRTMEPDDLVGTLSFLTSDDAALITGQTITVDGGTVRT